MARKIKGGNCRHAAEKSPRKRKRIARCVPHNGQLMLNNCLYAQGNKNCSTSLKNIIQEHSKG